MKRFFILVLIFVFSQKGLSQDFKTDSLLTKKVNEDWIAKFEQLSTKKEQIAAIKRKVFSDSLYIKCSNNIGCRVIVRDKESLKQLLKKLDCECKIVFILGVKGRSYLLNPIEYPKTNQILGLIKDENITGINLLRGDIALAMYGTSGRCGVVVMYSDSNKLKRKIKKL